MAMSEAEKAVLDALDNGATLDEAFALLPALTPEQLESLDERGDPIEWGMDTLLLEIQKPVVQ